MLTPLFGRGTEAESEWANAACEIVWGILVTSQKFPQ